MSLARLLVPQPFACEPSVLAAFRSFLWRRESGERFTAADMHRVIGMPMKADVLAANQQQREAVRSVGLGVIPILGAIDQRPNSFGTSIEEIDSMLNAALASRSVEGILLEIDSPGGVASLVPEMAGKLEAAGKVKPIVAHANSLAASAAYWLGAAASEFWVTPSGETGSIGVWTMHQDLTEFLKNEGVAITEISAGEFKTEGAPWKPLGEEAREVLQGRVDEVYGWFVRDVARFRGDSQQNVRAGYGRGRVLSASDSVTAKLVDRVGTFDQAAMRLAKKTERRGARADTLRRRLALDTAA